MIFFALTPQGRWNAMAFIAFKCFLWGVFLFLGSPPRGFPSNMSVKLAPNGCKSDYDDIMRTWPQL